METEKAREGVKPIKVQYMHEWNTTANPLKQSIHTLKNKGEEGNKTGPGGRWVPVEGGESKQKGWRRENIVDVLCKHVWE
jgi:hypothetical protein